ncbi:SRPBCC domain-containing protein [Kineosporia sp. R_H_3]|uniref:ArsR/SmtB family transcription factor n=1 Tax=Kineosporia sp. R_H_3 TaxID=1961848 RepID=UPI000B4ABB6E|nr:SRPBCC domain-containing protein [Kineosporia sp. R_H_3]
MDAVFKAIADPSRRRLLDALREQGGQSLAQLCAVLPGMTRYGVSAHLAVLQGADLVTVVRVGRTKRHFLNPVPLAELQRRWLSEYTSATANALLSLRAHLEGPTMTSDPVVTTPKTVFTIYIRASRQQVWDALTETGTPRGWLYGTVTRSDWRAGGRYSQDADGFVMIDGDVLTSEEPSRLVLGFDAHWDEAVDAEPAGVLDYRIEEAGEGVTRLTVTLSEVTGETAAAAERDTPSIYSSLKSLLETGQPFATDRAS